MNTNRILKAGEDLYTLSQSAYGHQGNWRELALTNTQDIFEELVPGSAFKFPSVDQIETLREAISTKNPLKALPAILDLSGIKQPGTGEYNLIDWIL
jgi:hypothetical protein